MADTALVSCDHDDASKKTLPVAEKPPSTLPETSANDAPPSLQETTAPGLSLVWKSLKLKGISDKAARIIIKSWRVGTKRQYQSCLKKWEEFCCKQKIDPVRPTLTMVLDFLTDLYEQGQQYSSLNTARSALSSVIVLSGEVPIGKHPLVCRFLKGVFQERPALPRYVDTWDVGLVLNYVKNQYPLEKLGLKELTLKLVMLLSLLSGQRTQTLQQLCIKDVVMRDSDCLIHISTPLKHTRPGVHQPPIRLPKYNDSRLCVVHTLCCYLERTMTLRDSETRLLISFCKPHQGVSSDTVSRWIKSVMTAAGVDTTRYKSHSTRAASTSAAARAGVPVDNILSCAGWSNCETFARFYKKQLSTDTEHAFATSILATVT